MSRPKVLYIAGWGRSGSTLLNQILGQVDGWFAAGELSLIWHDELCSCGATAFDCEFWGPLLRDVLESQPDLDPGSVIALQGRWFDSNPVHLAAIAREGRRHPRGNRHPVRRYADLLAELYGVTADAAEARVVIDSSKGAPFPYLIAKLTDIDLFVVHLVRDPRACAYSFAKQKLKRRDPPRYFGQMSPASSSLNWLRRNAVIETLIRRVQGDRYLRVRYEDLVAQPQPTVRAICSLLGEPNARLPFHADALVRFGSTHSIAGNRPRPYAGEIRIELDDAWRARMDPRSRSLATLAAAPLMPRYGYSLFAGGSRSSG
jgi:sulfotransferase family protein